LVIVVAARHPSVSQGFGMVRAFRWARDPRLASMARLRSDNDGVKVFALSSTHCRGRDSVLQ
jgi:hypothetical protein